MAASLMVACASSQHGGNFAISERVPLPPRKPPSFAAEFTSPDEDSERVFPHANDSARDSQVSAIRVAVVPLDSETARDVVGRFFMAVLVESTRELFPLFAAQASVTSEGNRQPAQTAWRARFAQLDYSSLAGRIVAPPQALRTYTYVSAELAKRDGAPVPQTPSEVVIIARPGLDRAGKARLFGERLAFRLRPKAGQASYEITEIVEDFRLP